MTDTPDLKPSVIPIEVNSRFDTPWEEAQYQLWLDGFRSCYLAGPMRGYEDFNYPAFDHCAEHLRSMGWHVITPSETDAAVQDALATLKNYKNPLAAYMPGDLAAVCDQDCVFVLPGWEASKGATIELFVAREVGTPVFDVVTMEPVDVSQVGSGRPVTVETPQEVLPTGSEDRKNIPVTTGVFDYFPAALVEVAKVSKAGNDKHNPGEPLHWSRGKSGDHADTIGRHLLERGTIDPGTGQRHSAQLAWRALAMLQIELEEAGEAPLARGAKV